MRKTPLHYYSFYLSDGRQIAAIVDGNIGDLSVFRLKKDQKFTLTKNTYSKLYKEPKIYERKITISLYKNFKKLNSKLKEDLFKGVKTTKEDMIEWKKITSKYIGHILLEDNFVVVDNIGLTSLL